MKSHREIGISLD